MNNYASKWAQMGYWRVFLFLALIAVFGVCALSGAQSVSAASAYDDVIELTTDISIHNTTCEDSMDMGSTGTNWSQIFESQDGDFVNDDYNWHWNTSTEFTNLETLWDAKTAWGVINQPASTNIIYVWVTNDPSPNVSFKTTPAGDYGLSFDLNSPYYYGNAQITLDGSCTTAHVNSSLVTVQPPSGNANWRVFMVSPYPITGNVVYFLNFPITFPPDYEGIIPPDVAPSPPVLSNWTPNFYVHSTADWLVTVSDTNFNTFDGNPFLCSDDLAPVLHYEIWRETGTETLLFSGSQSATAPIVYQFDRVADSDIAYRVVGWYECGDSPQFEHSSFVDFTITRNGTLGQDLMEECITEEFPFMDLNACLNNMYTVINSLALGTIAVPTWELGSDCTNLHTFADWLNLPDGYEVCAAVSPTVRNVVDPFIGFMLGIVTLGFIHRRSGEFNG